MKKRIILKNSSFKGYNHRAVRRYPEDDLQIACARYLDVIQVLWCHVANERLTSQKSGGKLKKKGVKKGVPDILIFEKNNTYNGLAIELKIAPNKPTEDQKNWLKNLSTQNWLTRICYTFEEFETLVNSYLND